jgi:hypothetical protein
MLDYVEEDDQIESTLGREFFASDSPIQGGRPRCRKNDSASGAAIEAKTIGCNGIAHFGIHRSGCVRLADGARLGSRDREVLSLWIGRDHKAQTDPAGRQRQTAVAVSPFLVARQQHGLASLAEAAIPRDVGRAGGGKYLVQIVVSPELAALDEDMTPHVRLSSWLGNPQVTWGSVSAVW